MPKLKTETIQELYSLISCTIKFMNVSSKENMVAIESFFWMEV